MNTWLSTRNTWLLTALLWAVTLVGALLGILFDRAVLEHAPLRPFTSDLPMTVGGTFFVAVAGAGGLRHGRRRRDRRGSADASGSAHD
ncbi:hypothetical protein [Streptomyces aureus]|uniref:hypothetical protein n=1 Tax=Streptomyces aureus TaxID=193461 RepID=UPI0033F048EE